MMNKKGVRTFCISTLGLILCATSLFCAEAQTSVIKVGKATSPASFRGDLGSPLWSNAVSVTGFRLQSNQSVLAKEQTTAYLTYDSQKLYLAFRCQETEMQKLASKTTEKFWNNDCLEIFLDTNRDRKTYYHFAVTVAGEKYLAKAVSSSERKEQNTSGITTVISKEKDYWLAKVVIPFKTLGLSCPADGDVWGVSLNREEKGLGENSGWPNGLFNFPGEFGMLVFDSYDKSIQLQTLRLRERIKNIRQATVGTEAASRIQPELVAASKQIDRIESGNRPGTDINKWQLLDKEAEVVSRTLLSVEAKIAVDVFLGKLQKMGQAPGSGLTAAKRKIVESELQALENQAKGTGLNKEGLRRAWQGYWQALFPGRRYLCWTKSPWDKLAQGQLPLASTKECKEINLAMGGNEYESVSFVLTNFSDKTADFAVSVKDAGIPVTVREAVWVTTDQGKEVNDALPLLEGNLSIPSGESREVWLTLYTKGVKPGDYNSQITITSPGLPASALNLKTKIYPVSLPDDKPIYTYYWDYLVPEWTTPEVAQTLVKDMKAHYVNVPMIHPWPGRLELDATGNLKQDYLELDKLLDYYQQLNPKMVIFTWNPDAYLQKLGGFEMHTKQWKAIFKPYITGLVKHLKEKGWGYDKFAIIPYDERLDKPFYDMAKLLKEIDFNIVVCADNTGTKAQAKAVAPYMDIWMPFLYDYLNMGVYGPSPEKNTDPKILSKKPDFFWTYANPLSGSPQESSPYGDYRLAVWRAWQAGMSGFGYWIYSYKTNWNSYKLGENWAVVYFANAKDAPPGLSQKELVVTGKRWEATREGVEDYVYLRMLKDALEKAGGKVPAGLLAEAKKILADSPKTVLGDPKNPQLADIAKKRILGIITRLAGPF